MFNKKKQAAAEERIAALDRVNVQLGERLDALDRGVRSIGEQLIHLSSVGGAADEHLRAIDERVGAVDARIDGMNHRVDGLETLGDELDGINERLRTLAAAAPVTGPSTPTPPSSNPVLPPPPPPPASPPLDFDTRLDEGIAELREQIAELSARTSSIDTRVTSVSMELANQLTELSRDIDELDRLADAPADASGTVDTTELEARIAEQLDAAMSDVLGSTERLAAEQARYEIQFRADLADLAERLRRRST